MLAISAYNEVFTFSNICYMTQNTPSTIPILYTKNMIMKNCDLHKTWKEKLSQGIKLISYDRSDGTHVRILEDGTEVLSLQKLCK